MREVGLKIVGMAALALVWCASGGIANAQQKEQSITVRVGKSARTYTQQQLVAMATDTIVNLKGNRKKPAIPFGTVLFKDAKLSPKEIEMIFVIGDKITILRGDDLKYLDKMVLASGPDKGEKPHKWSLAARDEETYKAVSAHMGSRRKGNIYRIDIVLKGDVAKSS